MDDHDSPSLFDSDSHSSQHTLGPLLEGQGMFHDPCFNVLMQLEQPLLLNSEIPLLPYNSLSVVKHESQLDLEQQAANVEENSFEVDGQSDGATDEEAQKINTKKDKKRTKGESQQVNKKARASSSSSSRQGNSFGGSVQIEHNSSADEKCCMPINSVDHCKNNIEKGRDLSEGTKKLLRPLFEKQRLKYSNPNAQLDQLRTCRSCRSKLETVFKAKSNNLSIFHPSVGAWLFDPSVYPTFKRDIEQDQYQDFVIMPSLKHIRSWIQALVHAKENGHPLSTSLSSIASRNQLLELLNDLNRLFQLRAHGEKVEQPGSSDDDPSPSAPSDDASMSNTSISDDETSVAPSEGSTTPDSEADSSGCDVTISSDISVEPISPVDSAEETEQDLVNGLSKLTCIQNEVPTSHKRNEIRESEDVDDNLFASGSQRFKVYENKDAMCSVLTDLPISVCSSANTSEVMIAGIAVELPIIPHEDTPDEGITKHNPTVTSEAFDLEAFELIRGHEIFHAASSELMRQWKDYSPHASPPDSPLSVGQPNHISEGPTHRIETGASVNSPSESGASSSSAEAAAGASPSRPATSSSSTVVPFAQTTKAAKAASEMDSSAESESQASVPVIIKRDNEYIIRCRNQIHGCGYSSICVRDPNESENEVLQRLKHRERSHNRDTKCAPRPSLLRVVSNSEGYRLSSTIAGDVFKKPSGVAALIDGWAVVSDRMKHQVVLLDSQGQPRKLMLVDINDPRGVAVDEVNLKLAVADPGHQCVWVQDLVTGIIVRLGHGRTEGPVQSRLRYPRDVALNLLEKWLVVADTENNRLVFYAYDGVFLGTWPSTSKNQEPSPLGHPNGVCVYGDYVLVADKGNNRIVGLQVRWTGEALTIQLRFQIGRTGTEPGCFKSPHAVTVSREFAFVSDCKNNRVQVFRLEDLTRCTLSNSNEIVAPVHIIGQKAGDLDQPVGVSVTNCGSKLFICDTHHGSVKVYDRIKI